MESEKTKLFSERQMEIAAFIGGPIPVGILFYKNFMRLNKDRSAYIALFSSVLFLTIVFYLMFASPEGLVATLPRFVFPVFYTASTFVLYRVYLQKPVQKATNEANVVKASNGAVVGLSALGLALSVGILTAFAVFTTEFTGPHKAYEDNRIYYTLTGLDITQEEFDQVAYQMSMFGYFEVEGGYDIKLEKFNDHFEITIPYLASLWDDASEMAIVRGEASILELDLKKPVIIVLRDYNGRGDLITKRINDPNEED